MSLRSRSRLVWPLVLAAACHDAAEPEAPAEREASIDPPGASKVAERAVADAKDQRPTATATAVEVADAASDPATEAVAPPGEPTFTVALRSDVYLTPLRTTDGTILVHAAGKLARIDAGKVVEVPLSGRPAGTDEREVFLDHIGGRWPDALFSCWMGGLPNEPGHPVMMRFDPAAGWTKIANGSGRKAWCYEGFAAGRDGALLSRKIAHDFEAERFALGPFVVDERRPGFTVVEGTATVDDPELPFVADWTVGADDEIWAVTGAHLVRLAPGKAPERFELDEPLARRSSEPLRVTYAADTLYVHGRSRDGAYLGRWKDGALQPVELPPDITREHPPEVYVEPVHVADVQVAADGDLWILAGRILWTDVEHGALWHRTRDGWVHVEPADETQLVANVPADLAARESVGGFVLDGDDVWVAVRAFRYGHGADGVLLTTKTVVEEVAWTFFP